MNKHKNKAKKLLGGAVMVLAYTSCAADVAANIAPNCSAPLVNGFTGRAVLLNWSDGITPTVSNTNERILTAITPGDKVCVIDNIAFTNPLNGSGVQSTDENGRIQYDKNLTVQIPLRGAAVAKDIVEPLHSSALGFLVIAERKDKSGDGSFVVYGYEQGMKAAPDGVTQNEYENGGAIVANLITRENKEEYVLYDTDYATTLAAFEALIALAM